jgi:hypothetical protein
VRRRVLVPLLVVSALAFPLAAVGAARANGDGTLEIENGSGIVMVRVTGTVLAIVDGTVRIRDVDVRDAAKPRLVGCDTPIRNVSADTRDPNDRILSCSGVNVRITMIGGAFRLRLQGTGIFMSVVGQGTATLDGQNWADPGTYSLNGSAPAPLPSPAEILQLQDTTSAASPPRLAS